jgi:hypothetical protein
MVQGRPVCTNLDYGVKLTASPVVKSITKRYSGHNVIAEVCWLSSISAKGLVLIDSCASHVTALIVTCTRGSAGRFPPSEQYYCRLVGCARVHSMSDDGPSVVRLSFSEQ